ncbi:MAG: OmpA family protein, partial [Bacteroidota bacterium]
NGESSLPSVFIISPRFCPIPHSPFIHPNGDVLYFSSNGHLGMGGHDVYYSEMIDGKFQKPVNMGYPINTVFSDNYFVISENKKQAYYASVREDAIGMADIYSIDMTAKPISVERKSDILAEVDQPTSINSPDLKSVDVKIVKTEVENEPVEEESEDFYDEVVTLQKELGIITLLKGKVIDATSGQPLKARIKLMDNVQNRQIGEVSSNSETGEFELIIPHGGNYGVNTIKGGYLFNSINFNLPTFSDFQEIDTHILMQKAEIGSKVVLKNVFFDSGKSGLRTESLSELDRIKELLEDNNQVQVQINGHTDNVGNAAYNKILSRKRAQSVVNYLIRNGVDKTRLTAKGYGEERPLVSNDDEKDGREINRRTEIEIIGINKGI